MKTLTGIFLDTGQLEEIATYHALGVIRGVTTNPTILSKEGLTGGWAGIEKHCKAIARLIDPLPLSVEVTTNDAAEMLQQARAFSGWAKNINVKIPIHGPEGGTENLKLVHELETRHNIRINVTAMMSAQQGLLAAVAGATYVSIFGGRVNNMGYDSCQEIHRLRTLLDAFGSPAKIIVGSTREALNIIQWFEAGADIVTTVPNLLGAMLVHPYSKETVRMFLDDSAKLFQQEKHATLRRGPPRHGGVGPRSPARLSRLPGRAGSSRVLRQAQDPSMKDPERSRGTSEARRGTTRPARAVA